MKRIEIRYGGTVYTMGHEDAHELRDGILQAAVRGEPFWLSLNHGEGSFQPTEILIQPGVDIAVTAIEGDENTTGADQAGAA